MRQREKFDWPRILSEDVHRMAGRASAATTKRTRGYLPHWERNDGHVFRHLSLKGTTRSLQGGSIRGGAERTRNPRKAGLSPWPWGIGEKQVGPAAQESRATQGLNVQVGDLHDVTCSCYRRMQLLDPAAWRRFEQALEATRRRYGFRVIGYVVMPEHVHLLMSEPQRMTLADALKPLKQGVSQRLIGDALQAIYRLRNTEFGIIRSCD